MYKLGSPGLEMPGRVWKLGARAGTPVLLAVLLLASCRAPGPTPVPGTPTPEVQVYVTPVLQPSATPRVEDGGETPVPLPAVCPHGPQPVLLRGSAPASGMDGALLRVNLGTFPAHFDPQRTGAPWESNAYALLSLVYEGLTRFDPAHGVAPGAAWSWTYDAGATEVSFALCPGLSYSDGTPLNAKRFEYALKRAVDPHVQSPYGPLLDVIAGAQAWRTTVLATASETEIARRQAGVQILAMDGEGRPCTSYAQTDCLTLRVRFERPAPVFHARPSSTEPWRLGTSCRCPACRTRQAATRGRRLMYIA